MDERENGMNDEIVKEYANKDIIVYWHPKQCSHSGKCLQGLPLVFKLDQTPWIDINAAQPEDIIKIIDTCPTGALKYMLPEGSRVDPALARGKGGVDFKIEKPAVKIRIVRNGPLLIEGPAQIFGPENNLIKEYSRFVICRCGLSRNKPFCDGTHAREAWVSED